VEKLRAARLVGARAGDDRRQKILRLTALGRARFAGALPFWEVAQQRARELLPLDDVRRLAKQVRRAARANGLGTCG
jgi:DNA-binding MarR family transcriptional regulator